jgi:hypothetical protein
MTLHPLFLRNRLDRNEATKLDYYSAKENGALALFFKPKWASGEILVHVIHAKQNETELH